MIKILRKATNDLNNIHIVIINNNQRARKNLK